MLNQLTRVIAVFCNDFMFAYQPNLRNLG